jgi:hypothetical protein
MKHLRYVLPLYLALITPLFTVCGQPSSDYLSKDMRQTQIGALLATLVASLQIYLSGKESFAYMPEASSYSKEFVELIAAEHGIHPNFQVKLGTGYAAGIDTIIIPADGGISQEWSTLDYALADYQNATDKEELAATENLCEHIGSLDHEFTHYKNHDLRNSLLVGSLINAALYSAFFTYEYKVLAEKLRAASNNKKWLYSYASSLGLSITSALLNCWYARFQEQRADEGIRNEIPVLKAMIRCFKQLDQDIQHYLSKAGRIPALFAKCLEKHPSLNLFLDPVHPPLPDRIARFEQRLEALEGSALIVS